MNTKTNPLAPAQLALLLVLGLPVLNFPLGSCLAQTTAFTYQGHLSDGATAANGQYDLSFGLFDSASAGNQVAGVLTNAVTAVSNGLFTVTLDFGASPFTGADRWLEIGVRTNGSAGPYETLTPRQQLTATPYATRAASATSFAGSISDGQLSANVALLGANQSFSGQNNFSAPVGIGTGSPATALHVLDSSDAEISLESQQGRRWTLQSSGTGTPGLESSFQIIDRTAGASRFLIDTDGAVSAASFSGNGAGLTSLNASQLTGGTLADGRLSANVALLNANNQFTGASTFSGATLFNGVTIGNAGGLTNLNAAALTGTVGVNQLSTNVALRTGGNIFSGSQQVSDTVIAGSEALDQQQTVPSAGVGGADNWQSFTAGQSGVLTRVSLQVSSPLVSNSSPGTISIYAGEGTSGALLASQSVTFANVLNTFQSFPLSVPPQVQSGSKYTIRFSVPVVQVAWVDANAGNPYSGGRADYSPNYDYLFKTYVSQTTVGPILTVNPPGYSGNVGIGTNLPQARLHVVGNVLASGTFLGDGSGLTNLNITNLAGTVPDARLSTNVALLNATNRFTGPSTFTGASTFSGTNTFTGTNTLSGASTFTGTNTFSGASTFSGTNVFSGTNLFNGVTTLSNPGNNISGIFSGNAGGLTNLNAAALTGTLGVNQLSTNVALRTGGNIFSGSQQVCDNLLAGSEALDQQQTSHDGIGGAATNWQSFTAGQSGALTKVALQVNSPLAGSNSPGTIAIYAGEGTSGALLASQSVTFVTASGSTLQSFPLSAPPQVQSGSKYTIGFSVPAQNFQAAWVEGQGGDPYPGGRAGVDPNVDYVFSTYVTPTTVGPILIVNPPDHSGNVGIGTNLPQARLHVVGSVLASGTFTGDGSGLTNLTGVAVLNAANRFTGTNTFTGTNIFSGVTFGNAGGLTNLNAAALTGTVGVNQLSTNVALRVGGNIFSGRQQVSDVLIAGSEALDQQQTVSSLGGGGTDNWQSFTAGQSGLLTRVALQVSSPLGGSSSPGTIVIYAGEGTNGALLASQSVTFAAVFNTFQSFPLSVPPQVQSGSKYTIEFSVPAAAVGWVAYTYGDPYPGGRSDYDPRVDYVFKTYVTPTAVGPILTVNPPDYSGNVGIGTNSPQARLHVVGNVLATGAFMGNGSGLTGLNAAQLSGTMADAQLSSNVALLNASQTFTGQNTFSNSVVGGGVTLDASVLAGAFNLKGASGIRSSLGLATDDGNYSSAAAAGDTVLRASAGKLLLQTGSAASAIAIATNNYVGMGTAAPATALHVANTGDTEIGVQSTDSFGHRWTLQSSGAGSFVGSFQIIDRTAGISRMLIDNSGNVGIGTDTPTSKLQVNGGITCTALTQTSDRNAKENFAPVSPEEVLSKVVALPITTWNFKTMNDGRHMGPMAQDFYAAFGLGRGATTITSVDPDGVALAAIQGLNEKVESGKQKAESRMKELEAENAALRGDLGRLQKLVETMSQKLSGSGK